VAVCTSDGRMRAVSRRAGSSLARTIGHLNPVWRAQTGRCALGGSAPRRGWKRGASWAAGVRQADAGLTCRCRLSRGHYARRRLVETWLEAWLGYRRQVLPNTGHFLGQVVMLLACAGSVDLVSTDGQNVEQAALRRAGCLRMTCPPVGSAGVACQRVPPVRQQLGESPVRKRAPLRVLRHPAPPILRRPGARLSVCLLSCLGPSCFSAHGCLSACPLNPALCTCLPGVCLSVYLSVQSCQVRQGVGLPVICLSNHATAVSHAIWLPCGLPVYRPPFSGVLSLPMPCCLLSNV
jgi:hypothetical protein